MMHQIECSQEELVNITPRNEALAERYTLKTERD